MIRLLTVPILLARLAFRPLDVSAEACLNAWRRRPAIVVIVDRKTPRDRLKARIDAVYPF